ncbi:KUP/HAK/KT family potassium transporter [Methanoregula sp.]|uniref:KUP/HAK/KT family potassium transporter n=1 Tax=Methanoregula sp. TaxID=2052170 RepID=UPI000CC104D4|nr:KUP/HAK/KT family potassium transporter [Methanoregula sp.]PKG33264.1 MAG: potassium transporter Kup [Methanoregula sp.]
MSAGTAPGIIKSIGLVFGDIGTSPIYALTAIFLILPSTPANVMGILSLVIWTLTILVTVEYTFLAMNIGKKGEGGTIVLREVLLSLLTSGHQVAFVSFLAIIGVALFIGDGVITPAISILSAVEGVLLIPSFGATSQWILMGMAGTIAVALFLFQVKGTERVAFTFGPVMVLWFAVLSVTGIASIITAPSVLFAISPGYAVSFLSRHGIEGFLILSSVILVATGGEALYADMGHLGKKPIVHAWYIVFSALVLSYLGQGAFLINHPDAHNVLFEMVYSEFHVAYVPFLLLSIVATVIASQAMISGIFSIVFQGITTRMMPLMRINFTSPHIRSQIYIDVVNWMLLAAVLLMILIFRTSGNLAHAYGLAVSGTMAITGILLTWIFLRRKKIVLSLVAGGVLIVNFLFLSANFHKIPYGGYWSLIIAAIPFGIILIYVKGQEKLQSALIPVPFCTFEEEFERTYRDAEKIPGTALYFTRDFRQVPPYIPRTLFTNGILYEENILVSVIRTEQPFGVTWGIIREVTEGFSVFEIYLGYMEIVDLDAIIRETGVQERTIFYGMEEILTVHPVWRIFAAIKRLSPSVVQFYKLPSGKIHGVITRIEM